MRHLAGVLVTLAVLAGCGVNAGEGSDGPRSIATPGWSVTSALPSPDGHHVGFIGWPTRGYVTRARLVLAGNDAVELSPPGTVARSFAWMPSSDSILVGFSDEVTTRSPTRFALVDLQGDVIREIPIDVDLNATYGIAVSPDGRTAVFPANEPGPYDTEGDLWSLDLDSGRAHRIELRGYRPTVQENPVYVGDDRVAFTAGELSWKAGGPNGWIAILNLGTGDVERLTDPSQTAQTPSVSPDGRYIVYDGFPGNERSKRSLWYVAVDGSSSPLPISAELAGLRPALEPSGRSVLVIDAGMPGDRSQIRRVGIPEDAPWLSD